MIGQRVGRQLRSKTTCGFNSRCNWLLKGTEEGTLIGLMYVAFKTHLLYD